MLSAVIDDTAAREFANSVIFTPVDPGVIGMDDLQGGRVVCWITPEGGWAFAAFVREDLPPDAQANFEEWAPATGLHGCADR